ncbi:MAG: HD domain-containing protein [Eubacteriales bacterium]|nr:HD domain-containing protein [Eubacteriales bacterium]
MRIPLRIQRIIETIEQNGYEAYLVGGCVRDMLMGKEPNDYDITTSALPKQIKEIFNGYTVVETGLKHGTVTLVIDKENIEITTYRIDGEYADNRRPESVIFTKSLEEDLSRRDFTVNAMAYNPQRGIIDLFGGAKDIEDNIIRCVGEPDRRFNEDGLRILRGLRFASRLGFSIHKETADSIVKNKELLRNIASERIFAELSQLICGKDCAAIIRDYLPVIGVVIPELLPMAHCPQNTKYHFLNVFEHTLLALCDVDPKPELRLAALLHDVAKPVCRVTDKKGIDHFMGHQEKGAQMTRDILNRLKTDNNTKNYVVSLVLMHDDDLTCDRLHLRKMLSLYSYEFLCDLLMLQRADSLAHAPQYRTFGKNYKQVKDTLDKVYKEEGRITLKTLKINGSDLMSVGITDGKQIGDILNNLLEAVINEKVENDKVKLIEYINNIVI